MGKRSIDMGMVGAGSQIGEHGIIRVLAGGQATPVIGFFDGGKMPGHLCIRHAARYKPWNRGQPMSVKDAKYEGMDPLRPDMWCFKCMRQHAWPEHEYLVQQEGSHFEVLDLSTDAVVYTSWSYDNCQQWVDAAHESQHYVVHV